MPFANLILQQMKVSRCCRAHGLPPAATLPSRPRQPWRGLLFRALPLSDGRADRTGDASNDGSHSAAQEGADKQKPAAQWPRVIADIRDTSYDRQSESDMFNWSNEELSTADAAKSREAFLLRLVTLGFGVSWGGNRLV